MCPKDDGQKHDDATLVRITASATGRHMEANANKPLTSIETRCVSWQRSFAAELGDGRTRAPFEHMRSVPPATVFGPPLVG